MRRLCENARFPGLLRRRACGCIRVGASLSPGKWMEAQARHRPLGSSKVSCPRILSAQASLVWEIPRSTRYLAKWFAMQKVEDASHQT